MIKNLKSQTTLFIIIGIILVIVTTFLFTNSKFDIFQSSSDKIKNQISEIVTDCITKSTKQGMFLLGFQGGRIESANVKTLFNDQYTDLGLPIRNWDTTRGDIPTINSMESSLKKYTTQEAYNCAVANLKTLNDLVNIKIVQNMTINTKINDENVIIDANFPVSFSEKNSDKEFSIENYFVKLEGLRIGELYKLAAEIYNKEAQSFFVEELVLDQIYSASDYSSKTSLPSEGMNFNCAKRIWTKAQLKENIANLNNNNFKYLYIKGSKPIDERFDLNLGKNDKKYIDYYKNQYVIDLNENSNANKNFDVEMFMPSTEITGRTGILQKYPFREFEVTPSNGNIIKALDFKIDSGIGKIPLPCIQIYHHLYTLDYDLMVKITDKNKDSQGYFFQFPLRVLIKNNNPKVKTSSLIQQEAITATNDAFSAEENRLYPMRVFVRDEINGAYLSKVNISYKCINLKYDAGQTEKPRYAFNPNIQRANAYPYYEGNFPFCIGGQLIASKIGYHNSEIRVNTDESLLNRELTYNADIKLIPLKEFKIDLGTFLIIDKDSGIGQPRIRDLSDGAIYLTIENKENKFSSQVLWPTQEGFLDSLSFLDKDGVKYNLSILYADSDNNLRGILEYKNWEPNIHSGNNLRINIPSSKTAIDENSYENFLNSVELLKLKGNLITFI